MSTAVTPQIQAEISNSLTNLAIPCFALGGKYKTGFQTFQELMYTALAEGISANAESPNRRARKPRTAASTPTTVEEIDAPKRRRGRPAGSTNAAKRSTTRTNAAATERNAAILKTIAAGYSTQAAMLPELKRAYDIVIRPNHLGISLSNLRKAGQLVQDGSAWSITSTGRQMAQAA